MLQFMDSAFEKAVLKGMKQNKMAEAAEVCSILIAERDVNAIQCFWEDTGSCMNTGFPQIIFNINRSENGQWMVDLKQFNHIKKLFLFTQTTELSFLKDFTDLEELYIRDTVESDFSFLEKMSSLRSLFIGDAPHFGEEGLKHIRNLCISQRKAKEELKKQQRNEEALILFHELENLRLTKCEISDITLLGDCKFIVELNLSHNKIENITPLKNIDSLYYLTLRYNSIKDVSCIRDFSADVYLINLRYNRIEDISVFKDKGSTNLGRLFLQHNNVHDFSILEDLHLVYSDF